MLPDFIINMMNNSVFYFRRILAYLFTPALFIALASLILLSIKKTFVLRSQTKEKLFLVCAPPLILLTLLASAINQSHFRYLAPLLPFFAILNAMILHSLLKRSIPVGIAAALLILAFSGVHRHFVELSVSHKGPLKATSAFLNKNAGKDDIVFMGGYGDFPVKFYTGLKVIGGETQYKMEDIDKARWIIIREKTNYSRDKKAKEYALNNTNFSIYKKIEMNAVDTVFENREDPFLRYFRPVKNGAKAAVYKRLDSF